ncbi:hypothetical protein ACF3M2_11055 [Tissierella carlieri]|uniref:Uncharacterized protein n=1 Tax=Tissierella carlieri TaxID=689904 RepID=A0ABT1S8S8_9FIRM|nr:hypothetical protein [Tissierella carlieri]MCQ4922863.1 hypothetical protein [Tissierella carlieri]
MNKEDQIFDLLERLYIELQDTKKELKEEISNVRTELKEEISNVRTGLKEEISNVRTELKEDIGVLNDNQMIIFDKLEKMGSDIEGIKEDMSDVQMITANNYKDIVRLKSVR